MVAAQAAVGARLLLVGASRLKDRRHPQEAATLVQAFWAEAEVQVLPVRPSVESSVASGRVRFQAQALRVQAFSAVHR